MRRGRHEALIDYQTWLKVQDRLEGSSNAPARANLGEDFALRGFVTCGDCDQPLSSCWSKGRGKHYPYYLCQSKGCASYGKSIRRADLEGDFEELLRSVKPTKVLDDVAIGMCRRIWDHRIADAKAFAVSLQREIKAVEKDIEKLVDRIVATDNAALSSAFEAKLEKLERTKRGLNDKLAQSGKPKRDFDGSFRTALGFLSNPWILWTSGETAYRRAVLKMTFFTRLPYLRCEGFRTITRED